ncbi:MAG: TIGR02453 family protein [Pseudomonadota bacterium]
MPSLLTRLIHDAKAFLSELAANNTHEWWETHRDRYDALLKAPALTLLHEMRGPLGRMVDAPITTKLFAPQRAPRLSSRNAPYHTHLHLLWSPRLGGVAQPGFFFGIAPSYVTLGAGQTDFGKAAMGAWRATVEARGADIAEIMDTLTTNDYRISAPALKRVPAPFRADHPRAALLRRKGLSAWHEYDASLTRDQMTQGFAALGPLVKALGSIESVPQLSN